MGHFWQKLSPFEERNEDALFRAAAKDYAEGVRDGKSPLGVIPIWKEIDHFTELARSELRKMDLLKGEDAVNALYHDSSLHRISPSPEASRHNHRERDRAFVTSIAVFTPVRESDFDQSPDAS